MTGIRVGPSVSPTDQATEGLVLSGRSVGKRFGATVAAAGVDLDLREGQILALTGESGSGKSTLLLCMAGILVPDEGTVTFRGRDLAKMSDRERTALRRTEFGFVFQLGHLVPDLPAAVNVSLPLLLGGTSRKEAETVARMWLNRFGVEDLAHRKPGDMSVGQSQRVAVARALVTRPAVVFADEPTGSLDSRNGTAVINMLVSAARENGAAIVLVTHSAGVARVADSEAVMRDGKISRVVR